MRIGSLCSGYGGLDLGAQAVIGGTVAWHVEYSAEASRILAHHWPDVPNHGDLTSLDWDSVEPVDVFASGYPCQPFSVSGNRKGTADVRHLWPFVAAGVRALRPRLVLLENVAGHVSLGLDAVLGDLAALGYDARWGCLRAAAIGAPHGRERVFIAAADADDRADNREWSRSEPGQGGTAADADDLGHEWTGSARGRRGGPADSRLSAADTTGDARGLCNRDGEPAADTDSEGLGGLAGSPTGRYALRANLGGDAHGCGDDAPADAFGAGLEGPRPGGPGAPRPGPFGGCDDACALGWDWGIYTAAVHRWHDLTRCVPAPVQPSTRGGRDQLAPVFVEWMQGLPAGHVTDPAIWADMRPSTARNAQLTALGNGVVPQQAAAAYSLLLPDLLALDGAA